MNKITKTITMPIAGCVSLDVEVAKDATEKDIVSAFYAAWDAMSEEDKRDHTEWEFFAKTCYGNVCSISCNKMCVD